MPRFAAVEVHMGEEQVLVQPAADKCLFGTGAVEQRLPLGDLACLRRAGMQGLVFDLGTLGEPALQGVVLLIGQAGDRQRHALARVRASVGIELVGQRAHVLSLNAEHDVAGQLGIGGQRRLVTQFQHALHQRRLATLIVEHGIEAFLAPACLVLGIVEQPCGCDGLAALALVHRDFGGSSDRAVRAIQFELARGIVARMARDAFLGEDRLHIAGVRHSRAGGSGFKRLGPGQLCAL